MCGRGPTLAARCAGGHRNASVGNRIKGAVLNATASKGVGAKPEPNRLRICSSPARVQLWNTTGPETKARTEVEAVISELGHRSMSVQI